MRMADFRDWLRQRARSRKTSLASSKGLAASFSERSLESFTSLSSWTSGCVRGSFLAFIRFSFSYGGAEHQCYRVRTEDAIAKTASGEAFGSRAGPAHISGGATGSL